MEEILNITSSSKVSSQGQITLPVEVRKALRLKAGDVISWLVVRVKAGYSKAVAYKRDKNWIKASYGMARDFYASYGSGEEYLQKERKSWE